MLPSPQKLVASFPKLHDVIKIQTLPVAHLSTLLSLDIALSLDIKRLLELFQDENRKSNILK
jgi:hypothetical protein